MPFFANDILNALVVSDPTNGGLMLKASTGLAPQSNDNPLIATDTTNGGLALKISLIGGVTSTGLLKTPLALSATLQVVEDYAGTDSPLYLSTTAIGLGTTSIWDNTNGRLGIGTTSPSSLLHLEGATATTLTISSSTNTSYSAINFKQGATDKAYVEFINSNHSITSRRDFLELFNTTSTGGVSIWTNALQRVMIDSAGLVGINNISAVAQLDIVAASATVGLYVKGAASTDIARFYDSAGAISSFWSSTGQLQVNLTAAISTCFLAVKTTNSNTNGILAFTNNNAATLVALTDTGSALTKLQFRGDTIHFVDMTNVVMGTTYGTVGNASSLLDLISTTKGFLPPRMTTTQKNAIVTPATGLEVYDTNLNGGQYYDGTGWRNVIAGDNSNLFWDNTNGRLGIGTISPSVQLHLATGGTQRWANTANTAYLQLTAGATSAIFSTSVLGNVLEFVYASNALNVTNVDVNVNRALVVTSGHVVLTPLSVFGNSSGQTADLVNISQYNGGTNYFKIKTSGLIGINNTSPTAQLDIVASSATVGLYVKGAASTDIAHFYKSTDTSPNPTVKIGSDGLLTAGNGFTVSGNINTASNMLIGSIAMAVRYVDDDGLYLSVNNYTYNVLLIKTTGLFAFGGKTSSFPSLKRSTTNLQVRLADDSGYAPIDASLYKVAGVSGFTGTGIFTSFTIEGGIITAAS